MPTWPARRHRYRKKLTQLNYITITLLVLASVSSPFCSACSQFSSTLFRLTTMILVSWILNVGFTIFKILFPKSWWKHIGEMILKDLEREHQGSLVLVDFNIYDSLRLCLHICNQLLFATAWAISKLSIFFRVKFDMTVFSTANIGSRNFDTKNSINRI